MDIIKVITDEFKLKPFQVKNTVELLDEGNTVPFIARYRKEKTGELEDMVIRDLANRLEYLRNLEARKEEVIRLIAEQGKLTEELKKEIISSESLQRIDDLYRPFRPKRRTRATMAKEKGLEKLAEAILDQSMEEEEFHSFVKTFIDEEKEVKDEEEALAGAMDIIAEIISDDPDNRDDIKKIIEKNGVLIVEAVDKEEKTVYEMYYDYKEAVREIANHRVLAINRGEKDKKLKVSLEIVNRDIPEELMDKLIRYRKHHTATYIEEAIEDGYKRLLFPSLERETRNNLTERAEDDGIKVFSLNLKPLLLQAPIKGKNVMALDPGFRTGCKVAVVNEFGRVLDYGVVYPTAPRNQVEETKVTLKELIAKHNVNIISIGNGTASRETELVVADMLKELKDDVSYIIVSEAGASIYSASKVAIEEFPDLDVSIRGAVSIARRLQDPLAELVKIEPKHIGVGQYQHDLNQKKLDEALKGVVEDSVNTVGVDLNTASGPLLKYVAGISTRVANNLVKHREEIEEFKSRKELLKVKGLGNKTFTQCAGFLRISGGENVLDNTGVHPESYDIAEKLLKSNYKERDIEELADELDVGVPTLSDIIKELEKPGRDPREDMPKPILRQDVLKIEDLREDMIVTGTVRNVVDFGAFIDIGVKQDGLVHISELANRYIKHPKEVVKIGDIVKARIIKVDIDRDRIALSMRDKQ